MIRLEHMYKVGLPAVLIALLLLLGLQYLWLRRLQEISGVAQRATLQSYVEAVGKSVEYHYRASAERQLNLPVETITQRKVCKSHRPSSQATST